MYKIECILCGAILERISGPCSVLNLEHTCKPTYAATSRLRELEMQKESTIQAAHYQEAHQNYLKIMERMKAEL